MFSPSLLFFLLLFLCPFMLLYHPLSLSESSALRIGFHFFWYFKSLQHSLESWWYIACVLPVTHIVRALLCMLVWRHYSSSNCFWTLFGMTGQLLLLRPPVHPLVKAIDDGLNSPHCLPTSCDLSLPVWRVHFSVVPPLHPLANSLYSIHFNEFSSRLIYISEWKHRRQWGVR